MPLANGTPMSSVLRPRHFLAGWGGPSRQMGLLLALLLAVAMLTACEEKPELPPQKPDQPASQPVIDPQCIMTLRADRVVTLAQLVLVLQRDPLEPDSLGFSLTTLRPGPDGSRVIFGTFVRTNSVAGLTKAEVHLTSTAILNLRGNGIFTSTAVYQPKSVDLHITSFNEKEAQGSFSGQFYHFLTTRPAVRPEVIEATGTFTAALIVR
jgi:hypothetical protein